MKRIILLCFLCLLCNFTAQAELMTVRRVLDGDTVEFYNQTYDIVMCRMLGIDTPEKFKGPKLKKDVAKTNIDEITHIQAGTLSTQYAKNYFKKDYPFDVKIVTKDLYQRNVCLVTDKANTYNCQILADGFAVVYKGGKQIPKEYRDYFNKCQDLGIDKGLNIKYNKLMEELRK